jgi:transcriptional regulator with XRE-family HTH domain
VIAGILATVATVIGDSLPAAVKRPGTLAEPLTRSLTGEKSTPTIATGDGGEWVPMNKKVPNPTDKYVGSRVRMRRLMLSMSQQKLGDALGLTFQQVQKYEKGTNRIGASRLQHIAQILQVDVPFFFDGAPGANVKTNGAPSPQYVSDFLATSDGLALARAYTRIKDPKLRRCIADVVVNIAGGS